MTNLQRLLLEIKIDMEQDDLTVLLVENGLQAHSEYNPSDTGSKRSILQTALSILEGIANDPNSMKSYKIDDMSVSEFHENLMKRIDQLDRKIRSIKTESELSQSSTFILFD